jgi:hypothetical protein
MPASSDTLAQGPNYMYAVQLAWTCLLVIGIARCAYWFLKQGKKKSGGKTEMKAPRRAFAESKSGGKTEMEALRAFAESVGYKGNLASHIMDGVVTECAGGAIEEIHWREKGLDGTLPVSDLNMPKLKVLDLFCNNNLKGEREERASEGERAGE